MNFTVTAGPWTHYFVRHRVKSSRYLICVILRQTHFLQVSPTRNITSHTLKGLIKHKLITFDWIVNNLIVHNLLINYLNLTLFRMGVQKVPSTSFSPVTSTNVRISTQNFLTFSFNPFDRLVYNFKFVPSARPKLLDLNRDHPSKKQFFWSNPYKIEVMITSVIQMLELPDFGHMTTSTYNLSNVTKLCWYVIDRI